MLLAVAGMSSDAVKAKAKRLATGDWSSFPPAERAAYGLAYKLSREPHKLTDADRGSLIAAFGEVRTVDLIWYTCWCNYMTRIADAFQLPLEKENIFTPPPKK